MSIVFVIVIAAIVSAAVIGTGVLATRDGYRRAPERPTVHRIFDLG